MSTLISNVREYISYRGQESMWAWILHRVGGLGIMFFLIWHILDIFLMSLGAEEFNRFLVLYKAAPFRILEAILIFAVIFHAFNGARIIVLDFVPRLTEYDRESFWVVLAATAVVWAPAAIVTIAPIFGIHLV